MFVRARAHLSAAEARATSATEHRRRANDKATWAGRPHSADGDMARVGALRPHAGYLAADAPRSADDETVHLRRQIDVGAPRPAMRCLMRHQCCLFTLSLR